MSTIDELVAQVGTLQQSTNALLQAVLAKGSVKGTYQTKAAAVAALPTLAEGERVWVLVDESVPGTTAWYAKSGGALVVVARQYLQSGIDQVVGSKLERSGANWTPLQAVGLSDAHGFAPNVGYRIYFLDGAAANRPPVPPGHDGPLEVFSYGAGAPNYNVIRFHDWRSGQVWTQTQAGDIGGSGWGPWQRSSTEQCRTLPGGYGALGDTRNWFAIGTIRLLPSESARITVLGAVQSYSDGAPCSGETIIHLRGTNDLGGLGIAGHFYGQSSGNPAIQKVALVRLPDRTWRVYVKASTYMAISAMCDTAGSGTLAAGGSFVPEFVDSGSEALPADATELTSVYRIMIGGEQAFSVGNVAVLHNRDLLFPGEQQAVFGPNVGYGATLRIGGTAGSHPASGNYPMIATTNGNIHIDPTKDASAASTYLNFYHGTGGTNFGNGAGTVVAQVTSGGVFSGASLYPRTDGSAVIGDPAGRYATIYLASNPVVTSDARKKLDVQPTLGLDFICALDAVSYRIADARVAVGSVDDGFDEVQEPVYEDRAVEQEQIVIEDGRPVLKRVTSVERVPVVDLLPVVNESGDAVIDAHDKPVMHPVPRMQTVRKPRTRQVSTASPGVRRHHGLLAQQVLAVLESLGLEGVDFAGLIRDEGADSWGLRYEQFVAPLILAVQQLKARVVALERGSDA